MFEVYQAIFSLLFSSRSSMSSDEMKESVIAFFKTIGLDEESSNNLFPYVRDGLAQQREYTREQVIHLCTRKAEIDSKAQVGDAFAAIYDGLDRMQKQLWDSFEILNDENRGILADYARQRGSSMQLYPTDAHAAFESSPETLAQMLDRVCEGK